MVDLPEHVLGGQSAVEVHQDLVVAPTAAVKRKVLDIGPHDEVVSPAMHGDLYKLAGSEDAGLRMRGDAPGVAADSEEAEGLPDSDPVLGRLKVWLEDVPSALALFGNPADGVDTGGVVLDASSGPFHLELPDLIPDFERKAREVPEA